MTLQAKPPCYVNYFVGSQDHHDSVVLLSLLFIKSFFFFFVVNVLRLLVYSINNTKALSNQRCVTRVKLCVCFVWRNSLLMLISRVSKIKINARSSLSPSKQKRTRQKETKTCRRRRETRPTAGWKKQPEDYLPARWHRCLRPWTWPRARMG